MKLIHLADERNRSASVGIENIRGNNKAAEEMPLPNGVKHIRLLKSTVATNTEMLLSLYDSPKDLGSALLENDFEVDIEKEGKFLGRTHQVYVNEGNQVVYGIKQKEKIFSPNGTILEERPFTDTRGNLNLDDFPIRWTGKLIPIAIALKKYVFIHHYQIFHVDSLSFDFLYNIAKRLYEENSLMLVGGGKSGEDPIVIQNGGVKYRGFLEGRIQNEAFALILHLSNFELKAIDLNDWGE